MKRTDETSRHIALFVGLVLLVSAARAGDTLFASMASLFEIGLTHNEGLLARGRALSADSAELKSQYGNYFPELSAQASYSYLDIVPATKIPFIGNQPHDVLGTFNLRQDVYDGGRRSAQVRLRRSATERSGFLLDQARLDLKLEVALNYHRLQALDAELAVLDENRDGTREQLELTRLLVRTGRVSSVEAGRHEAALAEIEARITGARVERRTAELQLCHLAGLAPGTAIQPADSIGWSGLDIDLVSALALADSNQPLFAAWDAQLDQALAGIGLARAAQLPSLALQAWYGWELWDAGFSFDDNRRYGVGLVASVPLFDGLRTDRSVLAAELRQRSVELDAGYFREGLYVRITSALGSISAGEMQVEFLRRAAELARRNLDLALVEYQAGRRSSTDVLQLRAGLLESQLRLSRQLVRQADLAATARHLIGIL
ncbi:MAG: TolC family protein [bacterium]